MARRIFIGDIQGCREELERLLEALAFDPAADELHPVGDFVNRGPDSAGVLRLMRSLGAGGVLGNHDLHVLQNALGRRAPRERDTVDELLEAEDRDALLEWLGARPFLRAWPDLFLVHAGLHPRWDDPEDALGGIDPWNPSAEASFAVSVRCCDAQGRRPEPDDGSAEPPFRPWFDFYRRERHGGRRVVFGHWSQRGLVREPHVVGLDTGCVWGKQLSAWIAEEDRVVQVPSARVYAPF